MRNIRLAIEQEDGRPAFMLDDVHDSKFDDIDVSSIIRTPALSAHPNCSNIGMDMNSI
jgi:hypothetical protein